MPGREQRSALPDGETQPALVQIESRNRLKTLWLQVYGHLLYFLVKARHRRFVNDVMALAIHLEDHVFPRLRNDRRARIHLLPKEVFGQRRLTIRSDDEDIAFEGMDGIARKLDDLGVRGVRLDTRLEYGQILDAFVLLLHVAPKLGSAAPTDRSVSSWNGEAVASAMLGPHGFHRFCSTMRFDRADGSYKVDYTFCELFFARAIKSIIERHSRTGDHRALFAASPYVVGGVFALLMLGAVLTSVSRWAGFSVLLILAVVVSAALGCAVYALGSLQYTREHQADLARGYTRRIQELLDEVAGSYTKLQALEKLRDDLVHMIVHDLKNPLFMISVGLERIAQKIGPKLSDGEARDITDMQAYTRDLLEMVTSLLDVSRLEDEKMPIKKQKCELGPLAAEAARLLEPLAKRKGLRLEKPDKPVFACCDQDLISRVMVNLLSNALKFTPRGGEVVISVEATESQARVAVRDTGPGIPPEYRERIFEKFGRVGGGGDRKKYSTGLGLTFCRLAIGASEGKIGLDSEMGKGSTFWFELPLCDERLNSCAEDAGSTGHKLQEANENEYKNEEDTAGR
jgi:signal transduction histidine kinase